MCEDSFGESKGKETHEETHAHLMQKIELKGYTAKVREDTADTLCDGIPAEIEARQKQYEYYRDKLLTFEEKRA